VENPVEMTEKPSASCEKPLKMKYDIVGKMFYHVISLILNPIGGVMVSVLASSAVDPGFEPRSGQTKDYKIGIYYGENKLICNEMIL
jgi:hypothetical protein